MIITMGKRFQITIPRSIAKQLSLREGALIDCYAEGKSIVLSHLEVTAKATRSSENQVKHSIPVLKNTTEKDAHCGRFRIFCFGEFSIFYENTLFHLPRKKACELIAYLAVHNDHPVSKWKIASCLWENSVDSRAMDSLYKTFATIKKMADPIGQCPVKSLTNKLYLDSDVVSCDLWQFEKLYHDKSVANWERAELLYKGLLFGGEAYSWVVDQEGRYELIYYEIVDYLLSYYKTLKKSEKAKYYQNRLDQFNIGKN